MDLRHRFDGFDGQPQRQRPYRLPEARHEHECDSIEQLFARLPINISSKPLLRDPSYLIPGALSPILLNLPREMLRLILSYALATEPIDLCSGAPLMHDSHCKSWRRRYWAKMLSYFNVPLSDHHIGCKCLEQQHDCRIMSNPDLGILLTNRQLHREAREINDPGLHYQVCSPKCLDRLIRNSRLLDDRLKLPRLFRSLRWVQRLSGGNRDVAYMERTARTCQGVWHDMWKRKWNIAVKVRKNGVEIVVDAVATRL